MAYQFSLLNSIQQSQFLQYIQDEYACMDDEFSSLIDTIIEILYNSIHPQAQLLTEDANNEQLTEIHLLHLVDTLQPEQHETFTVVLENMLMYINEFSSDERS